MRSFVTLGFLTWFLLALGFVALIAGEREQASTFLVGALFAGALDRRLPPEESA